jgi:addiction module HigA family antidote
MPKPPLPTHPGVVLLQDFLVAREIPQVRLAQHLKVPVQRINELIHGKRGVSSKMAWILAGALGTTPEFWMHLQAQYDLAKNKPRKPIAPVPRAGIHVVCCDDEGITLLSDGRFESRTWAVSDPNTKAIDYIALHQQRGLPSYRQGRVIGIRRDTARPERFVFVCEPESTRLPWPGSARGGPAIVINRPGRQRTSS